MPLFFMRLGDTAPGLTPGSWGILQAAQLLLYTELSLSPHPISHFSSPPSSSVSRRVKRRRPSGGDIRGAGRSQEKRQDKRERKAKTRDKKANDREERRNMKPIENWKETLK